MGTVIASAADNLHLPLPDDGGLHGADRNSTWIKEEPVKLCNVTGPLTNKVGFSSNGK